LGGGTKALPGMSNKVRTVASHCVTMVNRP